VSDDQRKVIRLDAADADRRLDVFLSRALTEISRSRVQRLIREGRVLVDGRVPRPSDLTRAGSVVEVTLPAPAPIGVAAEPLPLSVIYEDASLVVVDKPAGMVVHPSAGHPGGTLVNALLHRCADLSGIGGALRPGIVHRMDKGTSGLLVVAKNDRAHQSLAAQFKEHTVDREYLAVVWGRFREETGRFDRPVGRHARDRKRMSVGSPRGRSALTLYRVEREIGAFTLLRLRLRTGRTHQIRVHLSASGHPVAGDPTYGGGAARGAAGPLGIRPLLRKLARPALHAALLGLDHPERGERMRFESPLPPALSDFLAGLEALAGGSGKGQVF
jgi:23S rRNA pseudouridine1911/1915/1917 synthase